MQYHAVSLCSGLTVLFGLLHPLLRLSRLTAKVVCRMTAAEMDVVSQRAWEVSSYSWHSSAQLKHEFGSRSQDPCARV